MLDCPSRTLERESLLALALLSDAGLFEFLNLGVGIAKAFQNLFGVFAQKGALS